ncbi:MAG: hypothetical protein Q8O13_09225, partial [Candidatus Omnitrophota bacterium]|nr:hypothetical protein [Candidatus Omnitrophota bacterium]
VSSIQAEAVTKIEVIIKQLMGKDCAKQRDDRFARLHIYWQNQTKTINSPNCDKEVAEIRRLLSYNKGMSNISNPKTVEPIPTENEMISGAIQQELLNSKENYFIIENISAQKMKTEFLSNSVIWLIFKHPGLLDRPSFPIGMQNKKLFMLSDLEKTVIFYNSNLKILKKNDCVKLAVELLRVSYFEGEFGYANNTSKGRGYNVISNIKEISGLTDRTGKFNVRSPKTIKQDDKYVTEVWFWGAHNGQLHKFSLTVSKSKIEDYKDEIVGKLGQCQPLFYE